MIWFRPYTGKWYRIVAGKVEFYSWYAEGWKPSRRFRTEAQLWDTPDMIPVRAFQDPTPIDTDLLLRDIGL